jgi:hypothetical protein
MVATNARLQSPIEGLMNNAFAVRVSPTIRVVQGVEHEMHIFMSVLLLVARETTVGDLYPISQCISESGWLTSAVFHVFISMLTAPNPSVFSVE